MNSYELIYATIPNVSKDQADELHETIKSYILSNKGEVKAVKEWGLKKLAYPIQNFYEAPYFLVEFDANSSIIEELKNLVRLNSSNLRFSIVKIERDFSKRKVVKRRPAKPSNFDKPRNNPHNSYEKVEHAPKENN